MIQAGGGRKSALSWPSRTDVSRSDHSLRPHRHGRSGYGHRPVRSETDLGDRCRHDVRVLMAGMSINHAGPKVGRSEIQARIGHHYGAQAQWLRRQGIGCKPREKWWRRMSAAHVTISGRLSCLISERTAYEGFLERAHVWDSRAHFLSRGLPAEVGFTGSRSPSTDFQEHTNGSEL